MATVYVILLTLHNLNRWFLLAVAFWSLIQAFFGLKENRSFGANERRPVILFTASVHLQLVLGLLLFAFMGMQQLPVFASTRPSFQWEHLGLGFLAAVTATLASALSKRALEDTAKYKAVITWTVVTLAISLLMIPWWRPFLRFFDL